MSEEISDVYKSLEKIKGVSGILFFDKFNNIEYEVLPDWIEAEPLMELINDVLESNNKIVRALKKGELSLTKIECSLGNIVISIIFDSILLIITDKDTRVKRLGHHHKKLLEFKTA